MGNVVTQFQQELSSLTRRLPPLNKKKTAHSANHLIGFPIFDVFWTNNPVKYFQDKACDFSNNLAQNF